MLGLTMKKAMGELALIERIRSGGAGAGTAGHGSRGLARNMGLVLGIGDDCPPLPPPKGHEVLVTTDFTLEGRHFRRDWHPPESVGHRVLARGLSDLAAMGARPLAAFLSLALPGDMLASRAGRRWVDRFFAGLRGLAEQYGVPLAGGDTAESPCGLVLADIVLIGLAPVGRALRRSCGRVGDGLYVTGELGGAAAELAAMERRGGKRQPTFSNKAGKDGPPGAGAHPQIYPQPRIDVGLALLRRPLAMQAGPDRAIELALHGGEDYELLFAAPPELRMPRSVAGVRVTRIGSMTRGAAISIADSAGRRRPLKPGGWEHFAGKH